MPLCPLPTPCSKFRIRGPFAHRCPVWLSTQSGDNSVEIAIVFHTTPPLPRHSGMWYRCSCPMRSRLPNVFCPSFLPSRSWVVSAAGLARAPCARLDRCTRDLQSPPPSSVKATSSFPAPSPPPFAFSLLVLTSVLHRQVPRAKLNSYFILPTLAPTHTSTPHRQAVTSN